MRRSKTISLDNNLITKGEKKAKERGFDFSNYVGYLINRDLDGTGTIVYKEEKDLGYVETVQENTKVLNAIDNIMGD